MGLWDHITPREMTRNYGLAGGWLKPPTPPNTEPLTCPLCDGTGTLAPRELDGPPVNGPGGGGNPKRLGSIDTPGSTPSEDT